MHEIGIESSVLIDILARRKTIEGRLGKEKFLKLKIGDTLNIRKDIWKNGSIVKSIQVKEKIRINGIERFASFAEMFNKIEYRKAIPDALSPLEAAERYRQYYSEADEHKYCVLAISFDLV